MLALFKIVIWILVIFASAKVAEKKGRRRWLWILLAIFFGPLALVAVALLPSVKN
jgi:hypothetical protein